MKVIYSYLNDNPLRLTNATAHANTHRIDPLPLQKITEPRLISESDHSFPEPQPEQIAQLEDAEEEHLGYPKSIDMNSSDQRIYEEQAYQ